MQVTHRVTVTRLDLEKRSKEISDDIVAVEQPLDIYINGQLAATLFSTPSQRKEHVYGYLLDEQIVRRVSDIVSVDLTNEGRAFVKVGFDPEARMKAASTYKVVTTACGLWNPEFVRLLDRVEKPLVKSDYRVNARDILLLVKELNKRSTYYRTTGGIHSAAIFQEGKFVSYGEDVGRHNALDKAIGAAALANCDFSRCVVISSGRQPADMVLKGARVGVPIIVSNTSAIYSGIYAAEKSNVTLVAFARNMRMNVYTHPERIIFDES